MNLTSKTKALVLTCFAAFCLFTPFSATSLFSSEQVSHPRIGIVNFKECVEKSKIGKFEQSNFEGFKKQLEEILMEKEKSLTEISNKFNDPDYLDSLSAEAENELKHKFRSLNQELNQYQSQYYQALNQANFKIIQTINELIAKASKELAATKHIDLILNEESGFFYTSMLDVTADVIALMDQLFEKNMANAKTPALPQLP